MKKNLLLTIATALTMTSCAVQMPPPGGPEDKLPPSVRSSQPADGAVMQPKKSPVHITLSEWVDPDVVAKEVTVSPQPDGGVKVSVSGRRVTITANKGFADSTTYHINLAHGFTDLHKISANAPFDLYFSTGTALDSATISGRVIFSGATPKGLVVAFWRLRPNAPMDSLMLCMPDNIAAADSTGRFHVEHMKPGHYGTFAFVDANSDRRFNPGLEASFAGDAAMISLGRSLDTLIMYPSDGDTAQPKVASLSPVSPRFFSGTWKTLPAADVVPDVVLERCDTPETPIAASILKLSDQRSFYLSTKTDLHAGQYRLLTKSAQRLSWKKQSVDTLLLNVTGFADTSHPQISGTFPTGRLSPRAKITVRFNRPVTLSSTGPVAQSQSDSVKLDFSAPVADCIELRPTRAFKCGQDYLVSITATDIADLCGNHPNPDSTGKISVKFSTAPEESLATSISGGPSGIHPDSKRIWLFAMFRGDTISCNDKSGGFRFDSIPAGHGTISSFIDRNGNGRPDHGQLFPFVAPEPVIQFPDTIEARARWDVDSIPLTASKIWPEIFKGAKPPLPVK